MQIYRLPVLQDNYIFLLVNPETRSAAVVDPAIAEPVLEECERLQLQLVAILNTHHHYDHVGGNKRLLHYFPQAQVYGGVLDQGRIPGQTVALQAGDELKVMGERAEVLFVPGHTRAHLAYYFPDSQDLFCGDTLFAGGCGRLFEGTPTDMLRSLSQLRSLPVNTQVWCAHEYTLKNLEFALTVDPDNQDLQARWKEVQKARSQGEATVPSQMGVEILTNPFLRWDHPALQASTHSQDPVQVFARLRGKKDLF
jgi:hydroxyacylglutathione hydrolase